jgi:16S rRNA (cytosine967-C5)-methyltransferase
MVFCTCSTEPEEGEDVVKEFLKTSRGYDIIKDIPLPATVIREGFLRTYAHRHNTDGFFASLLTKP